jgi:hypothetical protein
MFSTTQIGAMGLGFPDVCLTPAGPAVVPIPYPNISQSMVHIPNNFKQFHGGGSVHNLLTPGTISWRSYGRCIWHSHRAGNLFTRQF